MQSQPLSSDCVDSDDGLSPRPSSSAPAISLHTSQTYETPFLSPSDEEVYENSPSPIEVSSATAMMVASIYGENNVEMKASDIIRALEDMAFKEDNEVTAFCGAKLATFEELLDPENVDPLVTRDECFVALRRWHESCDRHVLQVNGVDVLLPQTPTTPNGVNSVVNCTLSPCCRRVPNEEVNELRHQNKLLQKTIDDLHFQLSTNEKKLNCLKDEKLKLTEMVRELRTTMDMYYGYKEENEVLETDNNRLNEVVLVLKTDLTTAKIERDNFKRQTEDLIEKNNELSLKLEQYIQNKELHNYTTDRQLTQFVALQNRCDVLQKEVLDKECETEKLKQALLQCEELIAELRKAKERKRSGEMYYGDGSELAALFNAQHLVEDDSHDVATMPLPPSSLGGMSLFAELKTACEAEKICQRCHRNESMAYEVVNANQGTQTFTPEMKVGEMQTAECNENMGMYSGTENATPKLPGIEDRGMQTTETVEIQNSTLVFPVTQDSETQTTEVVEIQRSTLVFPVTQDSETQTTETVEIQHSTLVFPVTQDSETQTTEVVEIQRSTLVFPVTQDSETQTTEVVEIQRSTLVFPVTQDSETQTTEVVEIQHSTLVFPVTQDSETQTTEVVENVGMYPETENTTLKWPQMEERATQTMEAVVIMDLCIATQNSTPELPLTENCETQTYEIVDNTETYQTNENSTPKLSEVRDSETQTISGETMRGQNSTPELAEVRDSETQTISGETMRGQNSTPELPEVKDGETQTSSGGTMEPQNLAPEFSEMEDSKTQRVEVGSLGPQNSTPALSLIGDRETATETPNLFTSRFAQIGPKQTAPPVSTTERDFFRRPTILDRTCAYSSLSAESDVRRQRHFFADRRSFRVNSDRNSPESLNSSTTTNGDVDGSGDASCSPSVGLLPSPMSGLQQSLAKRVSSNRRRRNDARAVLDREMALLEVEIDASSRSTRRQFAAVGRAVELALEAAEDFGRVMQEERNANVAEGRSRSAATMTVMFPLRRSVSEQQLRRSPVQRPRRRGGAPPTPAPLRSPPPISNPSAEAISVTRRLPGRRWRLASCVIFSILAVLMVISYQNYDCRFSRQRSYPVHILLEHLERFGLIKRNPGPRPM